MKLKDCNFFLVLLVLTHLSFGQSQLSGEVKNLEGTLIPEAEIYIEALGAVSYTHLTLPTILLV